MAIDPSQVRRFSIVVAVLLAWQSFGQLENAQYGAWMFPASVAAIEALFLFGILGVAALPRLPSVAGLLVPLLVGLILVNFVIEYESHDSRRMPWATDNHLYVEYAARALQLGQNPYTVDTFDAYRALRAQQAFPTQHLDGDYVGSLIYPALSFLILLPAHWLGLPSLYVYVVSLALIAILLYWGSPPTIRPLMPLAVVIFTPYIQLTFMGLGETVWVFFIMMMILRWNRPVEAAIWYGLACAYKQPPWMYAPFLLILLWQDHRRVAVLTRFVLVSVATFFVFNLPFILWNPAAWFSGVFEDIFLGQNQVLGIGLSWLTESGVVMIPDWGFSVLAIGSYVLALALVFLYPHRLRYLFLLAPGLYGYFTYRSLYHYWVFPILPFLFAPVVQQATSPAPDVTQRRHYPALAIVTSFLALGAAVMIFSLQRQPPIVVEVIRPIWTSDDTVTALDVRVTNTSDTSYRPRFWVEGQFYHQPAAWRIDSGPVTLAPGETGRYTLGGMFPIRSIPYYMGFQLIAGEATSYERRAVVEVAHDYLSGIPDLVPNFTYTYWDPATSAPLHWNVTRTSDSSRVVAVESESRETRMQVEMTPEGDTAERVTVHTTLYVPEVPWNVQVLVPAEANKTRSVTDGEFYGLELRIRDEVIWVLFGEEDAQYEMGSIKVWMIDTPRGVWFTVPLDVPEILAAFDIPLWTSYDDEPLRFAHVQYPRTTLHLGWLLQSASPRTALYGHIVPVQRFPSPAASIREELNHPDRLLIWRGDRAFENRQYDLAQQYYEEALAHDGANAKAIFGLAQIDAQHNEWEAANMHLRDAEQLMLARSGVYHAGEFAALYTLRMTVSASMGECFSARMWHQQRQFYDADASATLPGACALDVETIQVP